MNASGRPVPSLPAAPCVVVSGPMRSATMVTRQPGSSSKRRSADVKPTTPAPRTQMLSGGEGCATPGAVAAVRCDAWRPALRQRSGRLHLRLNAARKGSDVGRDRHRVCICLSTGKCALAATGHAATSESRRARRLFKRPNLLVIAIGSRPTGMQQDKQPARSVRFFLFEGNPFRFAIRRDNAAVT